MKLHKFTLILSVAVLAIHVWSAWFYRQIGTLIGESLATKIMLGVLLAALVTVIARAVVNGHRDLLTLALAAVVLTFLFLSRTVFTDRLSLFSFFLLGAVTGLDEARTSRWAPLLMIVGCAALSEGGPAIIGGLRFYWLDVLIMSLGGFAGRTVICSNR